MNLRLICNLALLIFDPARPNKERERALPSNEIYLKTINLMSYVRKQIVPAKIRQWNN